VHVGEIHIEVQNLTAKINLDAQVLQLLSFNAGVDLSIDRVNLLIQNVTAKVLLEARLANLVLMIVSHLPRHSSDAFLTASPERYAQLHRPEPHHRRAGQWPRLHYQRHLWAYWRRHWIILG